MELILPTQPVSMTLGIYCTLRVHLLINTPFAELLAHNRTLEEMTSVIGCDYLIFQTLEDLKAACIEAGEEGCQVEDFEVGVFCGRYTTPVPPDYFEVWSRQRGGKKRKSTAISQEDGNAGPTVVANSGPVNRPIPHVGAAQSFEHHEDIRYVIFFYRCSEGIALRG